MEPLIKHVLQNMTIFFSHLGDARYGHATTELRNLGLFGAEKEHASPCPTPNRVKIKAFELAMTSLTYGIPQNEKVRKR